MFIRVFKSWVSRCAELHQFVKAVLYINCLICLLENHTKPKQNALG